MSGSVFLDTSFVIALINRRDQHHERALELADTYERQPLLTTNAIVLETGNALARHFRPQGRKVIGHLLTSEEVEVVHLDARMLQRAFALYASHEDKAWGLVDCASFLVMRERNLTDAVTFDRHFVPAGFRALMRDDPVF